MDIQTKDGITLRGIPDGTPDDVIKARIAQIRSGEPSSGTPPAKPFTKDNPNLIDEYLIGKLSQAPGLGNAPDIQGSAPGRFIQGLADLPVGALQLGANMIGQGSGINKRLQEINQRTEQLRGPDAGFDWSRLLGNVANPVVLGAVGKIPLAVSRMGKIGQGMALGAAGGAASPVLDGGDNFAGEKAGQIAGGMAIGGAIPAVTPLVTTPIKAGYHALIEPWANPSAIKARAYLAAAGDKADDIVTGLRANKQMVPGSMPTAGEAASSAGSAEFSALQKQAADINPSAYVARGDEQNAARLASLRTVAQDDTALKAAEVARKSAADPLYKAARDSANVVDTTPVKDKVNDLLRRNPGNRELVTELTNIKNGLLDKKGNLRTSAEEVASVVDGLKAAIKDEKNKFIGGTLKKIQADLESAIPGYERAQQVFRDKSAPINQMQVGQYLEDKLVPALSDEAKQRSSVYAQALRDAPGTIKRATGAPRFDDLTKVLEPKQLEIVNSIRDDLARVGRTESLAQKGAKASPDLGGAMGDHKLTGMFSRTVTIANAIIGRLEGKVNKRLAAEIAAEMLNPPKVAETLAQAQARAQRNKALASMVEKSIQKATAVGVGAGERTSSEDRPNSPSRLDVIGTKRAGPSSPQSPRQGLGMMGVRS